MQNKAARIVTHLPLQGTSRNLLYDKVEWMTITQLIEYHTLIAMYKIKKYHEPEYLFNLASNENIRGNINIPPNALTLFKKSFCYRGHEAFNKLPQTIKESPNLFSFKREAKKWINSNIRRFVYEQ